MSEHARPHGDTLEGPVWVLTSYLGADAVTQITPAVRSDLQFLDERANGTGGVNSFSGPYEATGDGALTFGPLASTLMAGPPEAMEVEAAVFGHLGTVTRYDTDGATLRLYGADGRGLLAYAEDTATLSGSWVVTGYNTGTHAVTSVAAGSELTALIAEDGTLGGSAGVNRYTATYATSGSAIHIGPIATTKMAGPPGLMDQERRYLTALGAATTYRLRGDTLELRDDDGALQVTCTRAVE